jgi:hypothetical protein
LDENGLQLLDKAGCARILLAVDSNGPALQVCDEAGKLQLSLGSASDGDIALSLIDKAGKPRAQARLMTNMFGSGLASFCLYDSAGQLRGHLSCGGMDKDPASVIVNDATGNILWSAP